MLLSSIGIVVQLVREKREKHSTQQIVMKNILLILLLVFFVQLIAVVYAMSLTLFSTSTEDKDTREIILVDFDSDGDLDYVAGNNDSSDTFLLDYYVNNGSAVFSTSTFGTSIGFNTGMASDIDGDGDADIISANASALYKYTNNGSGVFTRYTIASGLSPTIHNIVTVDLDNDGDIDFVGGNPLSAQVNAVYLNDGHGNFSAVASTLPIFVDLCAGDLDSDGYTDLAFNKGDDTMRVFRNSGTGAFVQLSSVSRSSMSIPIACGDLDGDGDIDVFGTDLIGIVPFINNGLGAFTVGTTTTSEIDNPQDVDLADLDNDGDLDAIVAGDNSTGTSGAEIFINNASGVFTSQGTPPNNFDGTKSVAIGDLDSDGDLDYIRGNLDAAGTGNGEPNRIYKNDQAATSANTAPSAPSSASLTGSLVSINTYVATLDSSGTVGKYTDIALGTDNYPIIAYYDETNGDLKVTKCGNATCSSGNTTTTVDSTGNVGLNPEIAVPADGFAVISYQDSTNNDLKVVKCGNAACSSGNTVTTVDSSGVVGIQSAIAISADGYPVISYTHSADGLKVTKCGNAACSSGNTTTVVEGGDRTFSSIAKGADDLPIITYWNNDSSLLKAMKCGNAACSSGNSTVTIVSGVAVTIPSAIVIGSDNFPVVNYFDDDAQAWKVIKCGNAACSSGNATATVATISSVIAITQATIAIGTDTFPIVSYYDTYLKVVKCGNTACSSGNTTTTIDSSATVGNDSSIFIGSDNKPVISYLDTTNQDLKFAHCGNTSCSVGGTNGLPTIRLSWGSGSDTETSTRLLQYQLKLGTGSSASNYVSGVTASPNWVNRIMPNGQSKTYLVKNLPCRTGLTYYWSVSAVDTGFKKTASTQQTFTIDSSCNFSAGGGGGSSGGSSGGDSGGGIAARFFDRSGGAAPAADLQGASAPVNAIITVTVFNDFNADGIKNGKDDFRFTGLPVTASGRTVDDVLVKKTLLIPASGLVRFGLPASDSRGYWIIADTGSVVLRGYEPTNRSASGGYVVKYGGKASVGFGFRRIGLLRYQPCLSVGNFSVGEQPGTDAEILLQRLQDSFGKKISKGFDTTQELISRRDFFTLLSLTHCIEQIRDTTILEKKLRDVAKRFSIVFPLIDLPLSLSFKDSLLMYSLLAAGTDVGRNTTIGDAADLVSPITREEALRAIETILNIPERDKKLTGVLPKDLKPTDAFAPNVLILQNLGLLPGSFQPILGRSQGLNKQEAALLLARAAFRGGKIFLHAETVDTKKLKKAAPVTTPTFLASIPALKPRVCLEKNTDRSAQVSFTDILPGDTLYPDLRDILSYGTKNTAKLTLWLFPVTHRPTEFGIIRGQTEADLTEPVSLLETVRDLLVLACLPPPTAIDVMSGRDAYNNRQGSAERRVPRDRISGLPRDATFSSRVLYRAQDHQKEFDLSLFRFNPEFLRNEIRSPATGLSVLEASRILASGLLMIQVKSKAMTTLEAENAMESLTAAIRKDLVGKDIDWRNESALRTIPFTRGMLLQYLATIVNNRTSISSVPVVSKIPIGEIWWERIR